MKRSKSRINSSFGISINQGMDIERCQEELLRARIKYNKLNQNYLELKVEYNKLEKDYKYNIKIIEAVIKESNIKALSDFLEDPKIDISNNINENNKDNNEITKDNCLSKKTIKILKEKSIYDRLKLEIMNLRDELREKEKIIEELKNSIKTSKFRELDTKFAQTYQELNAIKARNELLESMQADYVNSKNQIIFLLKQIDLYKKDNKKLRELYEKMILDYQNISKEKEEIENIKNFNDEKIKSLLNKNQNMKIKLEDIKNKNLAYYDELEKIRNNNKGYIDKIIAKKDKEISQYKNQITQLKLEIHSLQKKLEEKNKINIKSANISGVKKIKKIYKNKKDNELRKTDSDFFVTKPKGVFSNEKKISNDKIIIDSKSINNKTIGNFNHHRDKNIFKIRVIKDSENKHELSNLTNNCCENKLLKNIIIKDAKKENNIKNKSKEDNINIKINLEKEKEKEELINKQEEKNEQQEMKEQNSPTEKKEQEGEQETSTRNNNILSKLLKEETDNYESNNINNINLNSNNNHNLKTDNIMKEQNNNKENNKENNNDIINEKQNEKSEEKEEEKIEEKFEEKIENKKEEEKMIEENIDNKEEEKVEENKEKNINEKLEENLENKEEKKLEEKIEEKENVENEYISNLRKQKYNEEDIVVNTSKDKDENNSYEYNDFDSNIDKKNSNSLKEKNNNNEINEINNEQQDKNDIKNVNTASVEQKMVSEEKEKNQIKENNTNNINSKESNNLLSDEQKQMEKEEEKNEEENYDEEKNLEENKEEYKFSSVNEDLLSEEMI